MDVDLNHALSNDLINFIDSMYFADYDKSWVKSIRTTKRHRVVLIAKSHNAEEKPMSGMRLGPFITNGGIQDDQYWVWCNHSAQEHDDAHTSYPHGRVRILF